MKSALDTIDLIKESEGFRADWYRDVGGVWTIGYGTTGDALPDVSRLALPGPITKDEAHDLVIRYIEEVAEPTLESLVTVPLDAYQTGALVDFIYNFGPSRFEGSTLLVKLNAGDYEGAADELDLWVWGYDKKKGRKEKLHGLVARRRAEKIMFKHRGLSFLTLARLEPLPPHQIPIPVHESGSSANPDSRARP